MTKVTVYKENGHITRLIADGHTMYGAEGEDIVCAALSSVIQTALLGLLRVAGLDVSYEIRDTEGYLSFLLPSDLEPKSRLCADMILETMLLGVSDLFESWSDFIELEVK